MPSGQYVSQVLKQGYLMFDGDKHLRVRIINDSNAYLTFKTNVNSRERIEYEYEIPLNDGIEMYKSTNVKLEKTRIKLTDEYNNVVDIDILPNGVQVVEIEYENFPPTLPDYFGDEITGKKEYSNIQIAKKNAKK